MGYVSSKSERMSSKRAKCGVFNGRLTCIPKPGLHTSPRKDRLDTDSWKKKGGWFQPRYDIYY